MTPQLILKSYTYQKDPEMNRVSHLVSTEMVSLLKDVTLAAVSTRSKIYQGGLYPGIPIL